MNQQAQFAHTPPASGFLHFWTTLAGFLTATATLVTAIGGLLIATGGLGNGSTSEPAVISSPNPPPPGSSTPAVTTGIITIATPTTPESPTDEELLIGCDSGDRNACEQVFVIADAECNQGIVDSCILRAYLVELLA